MPTDAAARSLADDAAERLRALEAPGSVLVRAPAGSGKTGLLIQRFLRLLATVEHPEEIVAVTFTRKAAEEMRGRVLAALAQTEVAPGASDHDRRTFELAAAARAWADQHNWNLASTPARLRITTLDSLALGIASQMPWHARWGAPLAPSEDVVGLYRSAARTVLDELEHEGARGRRALQALLRHLLADFGRAEAQITELLDQRDQWLGLALSTDRADCEAAFERLVISELELVAARLRPFFPDPRTVQDWKAAASEVLNKDGKLSKAGQRRGLSEEDGRWLRRAATLPDSQFTDAAWQVLRNASAILLSAVAALQVEFAERGQCDFTEITQRAASALEQDGAPTELAARLDSRIRHLFVDEFQDTSHAQMNLLQALVQDWTAGDGRTLFLVGDAMQSIYGFRNAQVELFQDVLHRKRLARLQMEVIDLQSNFRSPPPLVDWTNKVFTPAARAADLDDFFVPAKSGVDPDPAAGVELHAVASREEEARVVADLVAHAPGEVAILVFSREHLAAILPELARRGLRYQGEKLRSLVECSAVRDLVALTRALTQPADRVAWLAVLRAPWCGLHLASLHQLCLGEPDAPLLSLVRDPARRAALGEAELQRLDAVLPVLESAAGQRGRVRLQPLIGWCWRRLESAPTPERAADANAYLHWLGEWEARGGSEMEELEAALSHLTAPPDPEADDRIKIMTIHAAKGKEFETVIVPALDRPARNLDPALVRWDYANGLFAAVQATGTDQDAHFAFVSERQRNLKRQEQLRQLYVAATRAQRRLHLLARLELESKGGIASPKILAPLARVWPQVEAELMHKFKPSNQSQATPPPPLAPLLQRVRAPLVVPTDLPPRQDISTRPAPPSYQDDLPRRVGEAVHALLQQMAAGARASWTQAQLRLHLRRAGIAPFEMPAAAKRAARALDATLADPRGRWLLARHQHDHWEWELADASGIHRLDRCFVADGVRWIVDVKTTAAPTSENLNQYRTQLANYARLVWDMDRNLPIRCALYFPMLQEGARWYEVPTNL